jgi:tetratricopeptide (TPR) repeat protein
LSRQVADLSYIALAQNNLGNLALKRGDLRGAAGRYQEVLATQRGMGNRFGEGLALNNLGVVALTSGNLAEAEGQLGKALAIREAAGDQAGRATSLRNLGTLALMKGELDLAQVRYGRALAASEEAGVRAIEAECRFCLADLLRLRQRLGPAQEEYRRALDLLGPGVTPQVRGWTLAGLAECEARLGKGGLEPARRQLEALPADQGGSPYALRAWAWVHFLGGRPEPALAALERARKDWITAPEIQRELVALRGQFGAGGP